MNMKLWGRAPFHIPNILSTFHVDTEKRIISGTTTATSTARPARPRKQREPAWCLLTQV